MDIFKDTTPKPTVLIVDDEPLVRMTIADMLRLGGFYVLEAASGSEALDVVANGHSVAALVSDIRMPAMDGVDLSHRVRAVHPEMPIVLVSGETCPDAALLPAGTRYVRKPPSLRELVATVFEAIASRPPATQKLNARQRALPAISLSAVLINSSASPTWSRVSIKHLPRF